MRAAILLVMSLLSGCDLLYGPFSKPNPNYCPVNKPDACTSNGWCWQHPLPQGNYFLTDEPIHGVWASPDGQAWAVAEHKTILHYNGSSWSKVSDNCPPLEDGSFPNAVWGTSAKDVWVVGTVAGMMGSTTGIIWHSTNGDCFKRVPFMPPTSANLNGVWGSSGMDIWVVGHTGTILHSRDGGLTFPPVTNVPTMENLNGVWGSSAQDVWVVGDRETILHSTNGGDLIRHTIPPINPNSPQDFRGIWGRSDKDVWIVGNNISIVHLDEGGSKVYENNEATKKNGHLNGIWGTSTEIWAAGGDGQILHSINNVMSWNSVDSGTSQLLFGMSGNECNIWAVGNNGAILNHAGARLQGRQP